MPSAGDMDATALPSGAGYALRLRGRCRGTVFSRSREGEYTWLWEEDHLSSEYCVNGQICQTRVLCMQATALIGPSSSTAALAVAP